MKHPHTAHTRDDLWKLVYTGYKPEEEPLRETLTTIGNGYFGTRGCVETERASDEHYPGTYIAGLYNKVSSTVEGREVFNTDFVNVPNWLLTEIDIDGAGYQSPLSHETLRYTQLLNLRDAVVTRSLTFRDSSGRETELVSRRFASMADPHCGALEISVRPLNYGATISLRFGLDGRIVNDGVKRYRGLNRTHLKPVLEGAIDDGVYITVATTQSHTQIALCCRCIPRLPDGTDCRTSFESSPGFAAHVVQFRAEPDTTYTFEKLVAIHTSRDMDIASPSDTARAHAARLGSFSRLLKSHQRAWRELWDMADMIIEGDDFTQLAIRLHGYHLLSTASPNTSPIDAGLPARGLHGEAYRGHVFWDSMFMVPFYVRRFPRIARATLMYRYRRLDAARNYARENGYCGAMYPWQSAEDGQEETQVIHFNPVSRKWDPDLSCRQRHVSIAVFYNIWEYFNHTGDLDFLTKYGAEMCIEIARFWASIAKKNGQDGRYHIEGVMGPDEFHEKYPDSSTPGIRDNAYTNIMAVWLFNRAQELIRYLPAASRDALFDRLEFDPAETSVWDEISHHMYIPITPEGIIEQFDGYMRLEELDWEKYRATYGNIHRLDRLLKAENDTPDRYKVAKQADALMAFYVIGADEVLKIIRSLGYDIGDASKFLITNYRFYEQRTTHGSTLSKVVHAAISRDMKNQSGMQHWFREALESDLYDTQGGTTIEGIHCGVMAGTYNIIVRAFAGIRFRNGSISINPALPRHWKRLAFKLRFRDRVYYFKFTPEKVTVEIDSGTDRAMVITVNKDMFR